MKTAREHPDTADVVFDVRFAYAAIAFVVAAFGVPALLAMIP